jgi:uncharacterized protein (DUF433 family)
MGTKHAFNRIYSFRDIVGLRTLGILRDRFELPLQKLRTVAAYLTQWAERPWSDLRFVVVGRGSHAEILFRDPESGDLVSATHPGQTTLFEIEPIAHDMERASSKLTERTSEHVGRIVRNRYVLSNAWVIAGTRIPTAALWECHAAGFGLDRILREYPRLTAEDVQAAIAFEEREHSMRAA